MQLSRSKSLALALVFCLLPNFGLRAQTTPPDISISDDQTTTQQNLQEDQQITITSDGVLAVASGRGILAHGSGGNTIINEGEISSGDSDAILLQLGGNVLTNSGTITAGTNRHGISVAGITSVPDTVTATRPAYNAAAATLDTYYFDNKIINEAGGTITGNGDGHGIIMHNSLRVQILNTGGTITAGSSGHGIFFSRVTDQVFIRNTGMINATSGGAIFANSTLIGAHIVKEITIHNTGTITSATGAAIRLARFNFIVNSGTITAGGNGIWLVGSALKASLDANPTAPAWDADKAARDAYYFNNTIINERGGTITGRGSSHGIRVDGPRAQIINRGTIEATGGGHGIYFNSGSGDSIVVNTGTISSTRGWGIFVDTRATRRIVVVNGGTITGGNGAIRFSGANDILVIRTGSSITGSVDFRGGSADELIYVGVATDDRLATSAFSNLETTSESTSTSTLGLALITISGSTSTAQTLRAGQSLTVEAAGTIELTTGTAVTGAGDNEINNSGTISSGDSTAIVLQSLNVIMNSGAITGGTHGIDLQGTAFEATLDAQATRPAYNASDAARDAYYFNNKVLNSSTSATITGKGTGHGIRISGARAQIRNNGGDIVAEASGQGIVFHTGSGQGFVYNRGNITSASGNAIHAISGIDEIVIHNDTGTLSSTSGTAIVLNGSLNLIVNSGEITGGGNGHGIDLQGTADADTINANPTRPAHDVVDATRDAYYFNNKVVNNTGGTITGTGTGEGINIAGRRVQILNTGGMIVAGDDDGGQGVLFNTGSNQGFVYNSGSITAASGNAIHAVGSATEIIIHNTGTIESMGSHAVLLRSLNVIVNTGAITGAGNGINLIGAAPTGTARPATATDTRPAFNSTQALRDAYYFNNKVINSGASAAITGKGTGHGINIGGARAQILNNSGDIATADNGNGINFAADSGESFVYNTGDISGSIGSAIAAADGVNGIVIHSGGTIGSAGSHAIELQSLNLIVNSGDINGGSGGHGVRLAGAADDATLLAAAPAAAPAWDVDEATRNAYYFNNTIINEVGGTITSEGANGHGIVVVGKRAQIFNYGTIEATGSGHGISFAAGSGESIVVNTGTISSASGYGIYADDATDGSIVVINSGTISGGAGAIRLSDADDILVIRAGSNIVGSVDFDDGDADELIYAGAEASSRLAASVLSGLETTSESDSDSDLGAVTPDPTPTPDPTDPNGGSGGGPSSSSAASLGNYQTLFALSDELILDLNAGIQDAIYEHKFSLNSEKDASEDTPWWTQGFGSFRAQDESDNNAKASHTLGGVLIGYDLTPEQVGNLGLKDLGLPLEIKNLGFFLGVALGSLSTDDDAELITQNFFGGVNFELTKDEFFYGVNLAIGITYYNSERSVKESGETVNIRGRYTGFFLSPEFIIGMKTQVKVPNTAPKKDELSLWERMKNQVNGMDIIPSLRVRYSLALLGEYTEDSDAADRISAEKRSTGSVESRAQVAFPLQLANQAWKLEPRLGLAHRFDLNKSDFDVETTQTETAINYDAEKESTLGIFGGLSVRYLKGDKAFKLNMDTILSGESLILRAQAGFGFQF